MSDIDLAA